MWIHGRLPRLTKSFFFKIVRHFMQTLIPHRSDSFDFGLVSTQRQNLYSFNAQYSSVKVFTLS